MSAATIAEALGEAVRSGAWWRCRCPVHQSGGPTLALRDGDRGLVAVCHAGCSWRDIAAELRRLELTDGVELSPPAPIVERQREADAADRGRRRALGLDIWRSSTADVTGLIRRYLASRGITIPIPSTLRVHGALGCYGRHPSGERRSQMVGLVSHVEHGAVGVSRTFLTLDGSRKAALHPPRLFHGPVGGGAVRLAPVRAGDELIVGEGIETTLSVMQATGLPGWAALSAGGIERLQLPAEVRAVLIAADNDQNGRGQSAAQVAAQRWLGEGRRVRIVTPPTLGADFNDVVRMGVCHGA